MPSLLARQKYHLALSLLPGQLYSVQILPNIGRRKDVGAEFEQKSVSVLIGSPPCSCDVAYGSVDGLSPSKIFKESLCDQLCVSEFRIPSSDIMVQGSVFRVQGSVIRVQGSGSRVEGLGFRV